MKAISVQDMKKMEIAANSAGYSYQEMMLRAGKGIANLIQSRFNETGIESAIGLVGGGNNGGDTLIALTELSKKGWKCRAVLLGTRKKDDPQLVEFLSVGGTITSISDVMFEGQKLVSVTVLLDGIYGTGFRPPLPEEVQSALRISADSWEKSHIVAVDCPSGVDCQTGEVSPGTLKAGLTICLDSIKMGMLKEPAIGICGEFEVVDLDLARFLPEISSKSTLVINKQAVKKTLPGRSDCAHKGTFGKVIVVGGCTNFTGAPVLAGRGAYAVGTGLVQVAAPQIIQRCCAGGNLEMTWLILDDVDGVISEPAADTIFSHLEGASALVMGPGMGREDTTRRFIQRLLFEGNAAGMTKSMGFAGMVAKDQGKTEAKLPPAVLDADALTMLAGEKDWPTRIKTKMVLTPHPGEMSRLTGLSIQEIQEKRVEVTNNFASKWNQTVLLKGPGTVIADGDGRIAILPMATSALAKGGTGDVLAGMIGGLLAQGLTGFDAAMCACWLHARAGVVAAGRLGAPEVVLASDVIAAIPAAYQHLK